jgi:hypothetical protein
MSNIDPASKPSSARKRPDSSRKRPFDALKPHPPLLFALAGASVIADLAVFAGTHSLILAGMVLLVLFAGMLAWFLTERGRRLERDLDIGPNARVGSAREIQRTWLNNVSSGVRLRVRSRLRSSGHVEKAQDTHITFGRGDAEDGSPSK